MTVQVAERAQVNQHVEGERVASAMIARQIVKFATAGQRQVEDLLYLRLAQVADQSLDLAQAVPGGIVTI